MIYFVRHGATDWNEFRDENGNKTYTLEEVRQRHCKNLIKKEEKKYRTI